MSRKKRAKKKAPSVLWFLAFCKKAIKLQPESRLYRTDR